MILLLDFIGACGLMLVGSFFVYEKPSLYRGLYSAGLLMTAVFVVVTCKC